MYYRFHLLLLVILKVSGKKNEGKLFRKWNAIFWKRKEWKVRMSLRSREVWKLYNSFKSQLLPEGKEKGNKRNYFWDFQRKTKFKNQEGNIKIQDFQTPVTPSLVVFPGEGPSQGLVCLPLCLSLRMDCNCDVFFAVSSQQFLCVSATVCPGESQLRSKQTLSVSLQTHHHWAEKMLSRNWKLHTWG